MTIRRLLPLALLASLAATARAGDPKVHRTVVDDNLPGAYQVETADVSGDGKLDIVALGGGTVAWYENPSWKKRIITDVKVTPGVISSAAADLDGDGKVEVVIAYDFEMNAPQRGKVLWAEPSPRADEPWVTHDLGPLGSVHRLRAADIDADGNLDVVAAPIFGAGATPPKYDAEPAAVVVYSPKKRLHAAWPKAIAGRAPVLHAIEVRDADSDGRADILAASNLGVTLFSLPASGAWTERSLIPGAPGDAPRKGSSEVHLGRLRDGRRFLATIDPWHGSEVVVCLEKTPNSLAFGPRIVLDGSLADGHALWTADLDGDGDDEVVAGHRGKDHRVAAYDFADGRWTRVFVDPTVAAQDLRGGDIDSDGTPDFVAVGGATHNVVLYRPTR